MKKLFFVVLGVALISTQSCKTAPEGSPSEEQSIETVRSENGDKVVIRLKPKVGDTQKTMMTMEANSEGTQKMDMSMVANVDINVSAKEADVFTYLMNYKSIKMNMDMGGMQMSYDSDAKEQSQMGQVIHKQMKPFFDNPMEMKMNERGKVTEMKLPGNMSMQQTGDFGSISVPLPEEPVGEGDSWTSERPMEGMGNLKMNMKVDKITVDDVVISTDGDMEDSAGTKVGTFTGNYTLDRNSGLTKDGTMNMNLTVEGQPMKMKINFKSL